MLACLQCDHRRCRSAQNEAQDPCSLGALSTKPPLWSTKVFKLLKDAVPRTEGMLILGKATILRGVGQLSGMCDAAGEGQIRCSASRPLLARMLRCPNRASEPPMPSKVADPGLKHALSNRLRPVVCIKLWSKSVRDKGTHACTFAAWLSSTLKGHG